MCGRFISSIELEELARYFNIQVFEGEYQPTYNAAPSQNIAVIIDNKPRKLSSFKWGLVPSWVKETKKINGLINARSETLREKPSFKSAFQKRRCLIPADGFFEWKKEERSKKPFRLALKNGSPFAMAGLWDIWNPSGDRPLYTCTIVTTRANTLVRELHDRMPVIIPPQEYDLWLDPAIQDFEQLNKLLIPYPAELMAMHPVSSLVNSPANNFPEVIQPI